MKKIIQNLYTSTLFISIAFLQSAYAQCPYDNDIYLEVDAPTTVGFSVIAEQTWGGEFNRINNMQAGYTYEISTCESETFDSKLTVYPAFGGAYLASNDDGCGEGFSSKILFTPSTAGDYDILLDEYDADFDCINNEIDMTMTITLISDGGVIEDDVIYIPVVVHVVYENSTENISDAQINSQITSLNNDFRKLNLDFSDAPNNFQSSGADMKISFCLASVDPNGNFTTGITRTETTRDEFTFDLSDDPKTTSDGGKDNWDPEKYLNIWVCDLTGGLLGYATFPSDLNSFPDLDGVVIGYKFFGTFNTQSPYNLGRTATHEVGHWLNLKHIWGDSFCGNDNVSDTPEQEDANEGCPSFPEISCSNGPNGDMFVNYMDYSNDACLLLFTNGQKERSNATISSVRNEILNSGACGNNQTDIKNDFSENTFELFPNPANEKVTISFKNSVAKHTIRMYNSLGAEIKNISFQKLNEKQIILDISNLAKGFYLFEVYNGDNKSFSSFIVN
jgi:Pregnancy-associated plasma protein-A/Secretion system C-terminal sorting domain